MAEPYKQAFGRYLRILRERRGLSLDQVRSLSRAFPEPITKSYLSRCENGHQRLALPKLIPLSRIYEVPTEAIIERMELDMELDQLDPPDTTGMSFDELTAAGRSAAYQGFTWTAYASMRDAVWRATIDPLRT